MGVLTLPGVFSADLAGLYRTRLIGAVALGAAAIAGAGCGFVESAGPLLAVAGAGVAAAVLLFGASLRWGYHAAVAAGSLVADILFLTVFLHFSGDIENPLMFTYLLPVVAGAALLSRRMGLLLALVAVLLFSGLVLMTHWNHFPGSLAHHHLAMVPGFAFHENFDPERVKGGGAFLIADLLLLASLLFGSAWAFGTLYGHLRQNALQIVHQSKMADIGLLAAGIAHEIGNPLSSMSAILQILELRAPAPEIAERLKALGTHMGRIERIVRDITGFARPAGELRGRVKLFDVVEKASQMFRLHAKGRRMTLERKMSDERAAVLGSEDQLVQVVLNLLLNAADATEGEGSLDIGWTRAGKEVVLSVTDHGSGVSAETMRNLFAPFFTTKRTGQGTGLGLFVSAEIVKAHGGRIAVESRLRQGSTFSVHLPAEEEIHGSNPGR